MTNEQHLHQYPTPKKAHHRLADMLSPTTSLEAKGNAARWYAEMIIWDFLSDAAKERIGVEPFRKLGLEKQIKEIKLDFSKKIINELLLIKDFGDDCSHYNQDIKLSEEKVKKIVGRAISLFEQILIDHFKKEPLDKTYNRATIFSTIFPSVREKVLFSLVSFNAINSEYEITLLHKYVLACVKNGNSKRVKSRLKDMKNKNVIATRMYDYWIASIHEIEQGINNNELPIAKVIGDCKRNFLDVLHQLDQHELDENKRLINIIEKLLEQVEPTEMGSYVAMKLYLV
jgi:hypothetical protein